MARARQARLSGTELRLPPWDALRVFYHVCASVWVFELDWLYGMVRWGSLRRRCSGDLLHFYRARWALVITASHRSGSIRWVVTPGENAVDSAMLRKTVEGANGRQHDGVEEKFSSQLVDSAGMCVQ